MVYSFLVIATVFSAFQVMRSSRLLVSTIWLAVTSALVSTMIYMLGAPDVAVIELSVGAGLVTVLFVFAFSIVGEQTVDRQTLVPLPLVWAFVLIVAFFLIRLGTSMNISSPEMIGESFSETLWNERVLDLFAQIVLIFAGVMGLLGLLAATSEKKPPLFTGVGDAVESPASLSAGNEGIDVQAGRATGGISGEERA
jgi:uncharacterized MnhB-related membrane protein